MSASDDIYGKVTQVLVESLNVDEGDVTPKATLQGDLGAESIDFLDIVFRLEREFSIRIPRGELFPVISVPGRSRLRAGWSGDRAGHGRTASRMPFADLFAFDQDRRLTAVTDLFTVGLGRYVAWKLGQCVEAAPNGAGAIPVTSHASSVHRDSVQVP